MTLAFRGGSASDLVSSLEAKVESVTGVPVAVQSLSLGSMALAADDSAPRLIWRYEWQHGRPGADRTPRCCRLRWCMWLCQLSMQPTHGAILSLIYVSSSDTVSGLRGEGRGADWPCVLRSSLLVLPPLSLDATPGICPAQLVSASSTARRSICSAASSPLFVVHVSLPVSLSSTFGSDPYLSRRISVRSCRVSSRPRWRA